AELRRVAAHVQHVVPDLEGQPQLLGVRFGGGHQPAASARRGHAQAAGPGDHGPGLEPVDLRHLRLGLRGVEGVQHLARHHAVRAGDLRQDAAAGGPAALVQPRRRQDQAVGLRLEGVPRQHGQRLAVDLVVGGLAPAQVVVVHAGQVIVDQGVGVDQLQGAGHGQGRLPVRKARQPGKLQGQHRPDALAPRQQAVS
ncbi:aminoacyl-tRNA hydrolase, partial [Dysosmobacter welbionis]